jgi:hypothetical protein
MRLYHLGLMVVFLMASCGREGVHNHSDGMQVRQAILNEGMLSTFGKFRSVVSRNVGAYLFECAGAKPLFPYWIVSDTSRRFAQELRDSLLSQGTSDAERTADSIWRDVQRTAQFMHANAVKHYYYSRLPGGANCSMLFVICNDDMNNCEDYEELVFHSKASAMLRDTSVVQSTSGTVINTRSLDRNWRTSVIRRPNTRLHPTPRGGW